MKRCDLVIKANGRDRGWYVHGVTEAGVLFVKAIEHDPNMFGALPYIDVEYTVARAFTRGLSFAVYQT